MTIKKLTVIAAAGAILLAGAIGLSMNLTNPNEMEMEVPETHQELEQEDTSKTLKDMENIPLYYDETEKLGLSEEYEAAAHALRYSCFHVYFFLSVMLQIKNTLKAFLP